MVRYREGGEGPPGVTELVVRSDGRAIVRRSHWTRSCRFAPRLRRAIKLRLASSGIGPGYENGYSKDNRFHEVQFWQGNDLHALEAWDTRRPFGAEHLPRLTNREQQLVSYLAQMVRPRKSMRLHREIRCRRP
jgi:hypothetical protein